MVGFCVLAHSRAFIRRSLSPPSSVFHPLVLSLHASSVPASHALLFAPSCFVTFLRRKHGDYPRYDYVTRGFPVGFVAPPAFEGGRKMHFLYNHVRIVLKYHEDYEAFKGARIVGFQVSRTCSSRCAAILVAEC